MPELVPEGVAPIVSGSLKSTSSSNGTTTAPIASDAPTTPTKGSNKTTTHSVTTSPVTTNVVTPGPKVNTPIADTTSMKRRMHELESHPTQSQATKKKKDLPPLHSIDFTDSDAINSNLKDAKGTNFTISSTIHENIKALIDCYTLPKLKPFLQSLSADPIPSKKTDIVFNLSLILSNLNHASTPPTHSSNVPTDM